jgi:hypothetical protein
MRLASVPTKSIDYLLCFMGVLNLGFSFKIRENHREYNLKDEIYKVCSISSLTGNVALLFECFLCSLISSHDSLHAAL